MTFAFNDTKNIYGTIWVISKEEHRGKRQIFFSLFKAIGIFYLESLFFFYLNLVADEKVRANMPEIRMVTWDYCLWQKCLKRYGTPWLTRLDESIEILAQVEVFVEYFHETNDWKQNSIRECSSLIRRKQHTVMYFQWTQTNGEISLREASILLRMHGNVHDRSPLCVIRSRFASLPGQIYVSECQWPDRKRFAQARR